MWIDHPETKRFLAGDLQARRQAAVHRGHVGRGLGDPAGACQQPAGPDLLTSEPPLEKQATLCAQDINFGGIVL